MNGLRTRGKPRDEGRPAEQAAELLADLKAIPSMSRGFANGQPDRAGVK